MIKLKKKVTNDLDQMSPYTHISIQSMKINIQDNTLMIRMGYGKSIESGMNFGLASVRKFTIAGSKLSGLDASGAVAISDLGDNFFNELLSDGNIIKKIEQSLVDNGYFKGDVI